MPFVLFIIQEVQEPVKIDHAISAPDPNVTPIPKEQPKVEAKSTEVKQSRSGRVIKRSKYDIQIKKPLYENT